MGISHSEQTKQRHIWVFGILLALSECIALFVCMRTDGQGLSWVVFGNPAAFSTDFFDSVYDAFCENPYANGVIYPAFVYLFYRIIGWMVPNAVAAAGSNAIRTSQSGQLVYHFYCLLLVFLLFCVIRSLLRTNRTAGTFLTVALLLSSPVLYAYERGNSILVSLAFLLLFFSENGSENKWRREFSLICLAVSAVIKIYPAVFGLYLLSKRKYGQTLRCVLYGLILFVAPFYWIGGLKMIPVMFQNIFSTGNVFGEQYGYQVGVAHILDYLSHVSGKSVYATLKNPIWIAMIICLVFAFFATRQRYQKVLALGLLCVLVPTFNWIYAVVYVVPAVVFFFAEGSDRRGAVAYEIGFAAVLLHFPMNLIKMFPKLSVKPFAKLYEMTLETLVANAGLWYLVLLLTVSGICAISGTIVISVHRKSSKNKKR